MSRLEIARPDNPARWANYEFLPSPILCFHGCDESIGEAILRGEIEHLAPTITIGWERAFTFGKATRSAPINSRSNARKAVAIRAAKSRNRSCWARL